MTARWLVTGATGFLGANAGAVLRGRAHRIGATRDGRTPPGFDAAVRLDLTDEASIHAAIAQAKPDVILNTAAIADHEACIADPLRAEAVNATAVGVLADAATAHGAVLVQISSDAVFDGFRGEYTEADPTAPFSAYGHSKLAGERLALANPNSLVIRTNFFGWSPSGHRSILEFFVNSLREGRRISGYTDFIVTSIYARDLVETIVELIDCQARGLTHLGSSDAMSKYDFGVAVASAFGLDADLITPATAAQGDHAASRVRNLSLDSSRAEALLGHRLPTQAEGIARARADRLR